MDTPLAMILPTYRDDEAEKRYTMMDTFRVRVSELNAHAGTQSHIPLPNEPVKTTMNGEEVLLASLEDEYAFFLQVDEEDGTDLAPDLLDKNDKVLTETELKLIDEERKLQQAKREVDAIVARFQQELTQIENMPFEEKLAWIKNYKRKP